MSGDAVQVNPPDVQPLKRIVSIYGKEGFRIYLPMQCSNLLWEAPAQT